MQRLYSLLKEINSEGNPYEGILIEAFGLEQINQQLHHHGFLKLQINSVEPYQIQEPK